MAARDALGSIDRFRLRRVRLGHGVCARPRTGSRSGVAMQQRVESSGAPEHLGRFTFAPPRHFVLPAVLLLLSEEPSSRLRARQGAARVPLRRRRPARGVPGAGAAREGRPGRDVVGGVEGRSGAPGLRPHRQTAGMRCARGWGSSRKSATRSTGCCAATCATGTRRRAARRGGSALGPSAASGATPVPTSTRRPRSAPSARHAGERIPAARVDGRTARSRFRRGAGALRGADRSAVDGRPDHVRCPRHHGLDRLSRRRR